MINTFLVKSKALLSMYWIEKGYPAPAPAAATSDPPSAQQPAKNQVLLGTPLQQMIYHLKSCLPFMPMTPPPSLLLEPQPATASTPCTVEFHVMPVPPEPIPSTFVLEKKTVVSMIGNGYDNTQVPKAFIVRLQSGPSITDKSSHLAKYLNRNTETCAHMLLLDIANGEDKIDHTTISKCYELITYAAANSTAQIIGIITTNVTYESNLAASISKCVKSRSILHYCAAGDEGIAIQKNALTHLPIALADAQDLVCIGQSLQGPELIAAPTSNHGPGVDIFADGSNSVMATLNVSSISAAAWNNTHCSKEKLVMAIKVQCLGDKFLPTVDFQLYQKMLLSLTKEGPEQGVLVRFQTYCRLCRAPRCPNQFCPNCQIPASDSVNKMLERRCTKQGHTIFNVLLCNNCKFCALMSKTSSVKHCTKPMRIVCDLCGDPIPQSNLDAHKNTSECKDITIARFGNASDETSTTTTNLDAQNLRIPNREEQEKLLLKTMITFFETLKDSGSLEDFTERFRQFFEQSVAPTDTNAVQERKSFLDSIWQDVSMANDDDRQFFELFLPLNHQNESRSSNQSTSM